MSNKKTPSTHSFMSKNRNRLGYAIAVISSIILFIVVYSQFELVFDWIIPKRDELHLQTTDINSQFKVQFFFFVVISLTPIFVFAMWKVAKIETLNNRIFSSLVVLSTMAIAIFIQHQLIKSTIQNQSNLSESNEDLVYNSLLIEHSNFEFSVLVGQILGSIICYLTLRPKRS